MLRAKPLVLAIAATAFAAAMPDARADVVPPRPARCPDGSIPQTSHSGPYCWVPAPCTTDERCKPFESDAKTALVCRPTAVCVRPKALFRKSGEKHDAPEAVGSCDGAASCDSGATCERENRCAPPLGPGASTAPSVSGPAQPAAPAPPASDPAPSAAPRSSCFCAAGQAPPTGAGLGGAALLVAAALVRRATRRRLGDARLPVPSPDRRVSGSGC